MGSNPTGGTSETAVLTAVIFATVAQLAEQLTCNEQVVGSSPTGGSTFIERRITVWIPINDRKPVTSGHYIASIGTPFEEDVVEQVYYDTETENFYYSDDCRDRVMTATAWREMPPPFRMVSDSNITHMLSFRDTVEARQHCERSECQTCPLHGGRCVHTDLTAAVNGWLEYILDKLDNAEKTLENISDKEWLELLE